MWRESIEAKVGSLKHPAWGPEHCRRLYMLCREISALENLPVDDDIVFAAAWLHDIGSFDEFCVGETPPECAALAADKLLKRSDFPAEKLPTVVRIIREHSFEGEQRDTAEARVLRDADMLEFTGPVGIVRLLSSVGLEEWLPDTGTALGLAREFCEKLPAEMYTETARRIGERRAAAGIEFLDRLEADAGGFKAL
jgi:HD superfamily phosphodiesterase